MLFWIPIFISWLFSKQCMQACYGIKNFALSIVINTCMSWKSQERRVHGISEQTVCTYFLKRSCLQFWLGSYHYILLRSGCTTGQYTFCIKLTLNGRSTPAVILFLQKVEYLPHLRFGTSYCNTWSSFTEWVDWILWNCI